MSGLVTLRATFTDLLHAQLTVYSNSDKKGLFKLTVYQSFSVSLTMENQLKIDRSFRTNLLFFYNQTKFDVLAGCL